MKPDMRRYQREWARRKRAQVLNEKQREAATCPLRHGPGRCGGELAWVRAADRSWKRSCPRCERRLAGICQECALPVEGRVRSALRCAEHKRLERNAYSARYVQRHYSKTRKKWQAYHRRHAAEKAAYKKLWRKANREKIRAQKRRAALRQPAHVLQYHRGNRMAAEIEGRKFGVPHPRECLSCPTQVTGRAKKCASCKERERQEARRLLAAWAA